MPQTSPISWLTLILVLTAALLILGTKTNTFKTSSNKATLASYKKWSW